MLKWRFNIVKCRINFGKARDSVTQSVVCLYQCWSFERWSSKHRLHECTQFFGYADLLHFNTETSLGCSTHKFGPKLYGQFGEHTSNQNFEGFTKAGCPQKGLILPCPASVQRYYERDSGLPLATMWFDQIHWPCRRPIWFGASPVRFNMSLSGGISINCLPMLRRKFSYDLAFTMPQADQSVPNCMAATVIYCDAIVAAS